MNKSEFIKSLEALTEELKNEPPTINEKTLLKIYKLGWSEAIDYVKHELEGSSVLVNDEVDLGSPLAEVSATIYINKEVDINQNFINDFIQRVEMSKGNENFLLGDAMERIKKLLE